MTASPMANFKTTPGWLLALSISLVFLLMFIVGIIVLLDRGVGIWGLNMPVAWAFAITNFVWWVGIGHAGTFISAILFLIRQELRTAISRFAETMTVFAVMCAGLFPVFHLGRPWMAYWLFPYYDTMDLWPQFRSPLVWDVFAVSTYLTVSTIFWYMGLVPDLAIYRDRSETRLKQRFYAVLALGWRGSSDQWRSYRWFYLLMAGLATPLVIAVHSIVGLDFAGALTPGWHSTIFPPYFVAGAIFSGFAMVVTIGVPLRHALNLQSVITHRHFDLCARFLLGMSVLVSYGYFMEFFSAFQSGDPGDVSMTIARYTGTYALASWTMIFCNVCVPQLLWSQKVRNSLPVLFIISLFVNLGMWMERFVIVVTSLHHNFLPSSEHIYLPTRWDFIFLFGSMGLFATLYLLFARFFPVLALSELRKDSQQAKEGL